MEELDICILKALLENKNYALEFAYESNEKLFSVELWQFVKVFCDLVRVYKDPPSKRVMLEKIDQSKREAFHRHAVSIFERIEKCQYDTKDYKHDLEKLKKRFSEKLISNLKDNLAKEDIIDVSKSHSSIQNTLNELKGINSTKIYKDGSLKDYADDFKNIYSAKLQNPDVGGGIKTGYTFIDHATGGCKPGELFIYCGTTASGKSLLLMSTGIQMWLGDNTIDTANHFRKGCNVLLFSLEISYESYMERVIARLAMVKQRSIRDATLTDEEKARVSKAFKFVKTYPYSFKVVDLPRKASAYTIEMIINEQADKGYKPDVVIIDYMNLMDADIGKDRKDWEVQAAISENCHELCRKSQIILWSAVQMNPKITEGDGGGGIKALRRSTQIGDNCDAIIAINTRKNEKNFPDLSCVFLKNRKGELISGNLHKQMDCCAILDKRIDFNSDPEDISSLI